MQSGKTGIGSKKHGQGGHTVNNSHFTGKKSPFNSRKRKQKKTKKRNSKNAALMLINTKNIHKSREKRKRNRKPVHPGEILGKNYLRPLKITVEELAKRIMVSADKIESLIKEERKVDSEMAFRLSRAFNTLPMYWLSFQMNHDEWVAKKEKTHWEDIKPLV